MNDRAALIFLPFVVTGSYAVVWLSDEFDEWRIPVFAFFAVPVAILLYGSWVWRGRLPMAGTLIGRWLLGLLVACFGWGNLMLLNALTRDRKEAVHQAFKVGAVDRTFLAAFQRGGLGLLYRMRW